MKTTKKTKTKRKFFLLLASFLFISLVSFVSSEIVYQDENLVMGYISDEQTADVSNYDTCFTAIGDSLWIQSWNTRNWRPEISCYEENGLIKMDTNSRAEGRCSYVCYNSPIINKKVLSGSVSTDTFIGKDLKCTLNIGNFEKPRKPRESGEGSFLCSYDEKTGMISLTTGSSSRELKSCGYVCVDESAKKATKVISNNYDVFSGQENIGTDLSCSVGSNYFFTPFSNAWIRSASYNSFTGVINKGFTGGRKGCAKKDVYHRISYSYFCIKDSFEIKCFDDSDCDDSNPRTENICKNPGTKDSYCVTREIECFNDAECGTDGFVGENFCKNNDVYRKFQEFTCNKPGTGDSFCSSDIFAKLIESCADDEMCYKGECVKKDQDPPVIELLKPKAGEDVISPVEFKYNVEDESDLEYCNIFINSIQVVKDTSAKLGINYFNYNLPIGNYFWFVECADEYGNLGQSNTQSFKVIEEIEPVCYKDSD